MQNMFRFLGSEAVLPGDVKLSRFGQPVLLDQAEAEEMVKAETSLPIIPEPLWQGLGITKLELETFGAPATWGNPEAQAFIAKRNAAFAAHTAFRAELLEVNLGE